MRCEISNANTTVESQTDLSKAARCRLHSVKGEPLFFADWLRPVFIHCEVPAESLQRDVPFPLDLHQGKAYVSLVAFTMKRMRPRVGGKITEWLFRPIASNDFLNVRTYVRHDDEPGIYFLTEWMNNRVSVRLGPKTFGLPYHFGELDYRQEMETEDFPGSALVAQTFLSAGSRDILVPGFKRRGWRLESRLNPQAGKPALQPNRTANLSGTVRAKNSSACLTYSAALHPGQRFVPCPIDSLDEFLLERYTAFTAQGAARHFRTTGRLSLPFTARRFFRIWHPPWKQTPIDVSVSDDTLIRQTWPWFAEARLIGGHYSPGATDVWMGRPQRVDR